jgi:hypothetical protein
MTSPVVPDPTGFSFGMWVDVTKATANDRVFDYGDSGPSNGTTLTVLSTGALAWVIYNTTNIHSSLSVSNYVGRWVHVAGTYKTNEAKLYVNGVLTSSDTSIGMTAPTQTLTFGRRSAASSNFSRCNLSSIVWHNTTTPWTAAQVLALYQSGTVPTGATAVYPLSEGAGSIAYDTSGNGNNGTITSGTWTRDTPTKTRKLVNNNLVYNGDFEIAPQVNVPTTTQFRWIDGTAAGASSPINIFGWGLQTGSATATALFDSTVSHSGNYSLKLSATATASSVKVSNKANSSYFGSMSPVLPSTSYTISGWYKTSVTSGTATTGVMVQAIGKINEDNNEDVTYTAVSGVKTTTDWTYFTYTFTTDSNINYIKTAFRINNDGAATLIMDAWFDDIQLYPTTPVTRNVATGRSIATGRSAA